MTNNAKPLNPDSLSNRMRTADRRGLLVTSIPKWVAWAIIAWQVRLSIEALAGKNGLASFLIRFGRETSFWELGCWIAGLLGILFGLYNHHLLRIQITKGTTGDTVLEHREGGLWRQ